eukprot:1148949-Amphidinium_carterae.1
MLVIRVAYCSAALTTLLFQFNALSLGQSEVVACSQVPVNVAAHTLPHEVAYYAGSVYAFATSAECLSTLSGVMTIVAAIEFVHGVLSAATRPK